MEFKTVPTNGSIDNWLGITGTTDVNETFTLTMKAGNDFTSDGNDFTAPGPEWTTTAAGTAGFQFQYNSGTKMGVAPRGNSTKFNNGELLWFEVSDLEEGNYIEWEGYSMQDNNADCGSMFTSATTLRLTR